MKKDRVTGLIALVLGIIVMVMTIQLPKSTMRGDIGPKVFPGICAAIFIITGLYLIIKNESAQKGTDPYTAEALRRFALIGGVVLVYIIALNLIGFLVPTFVVLFVISTLFADGKDVALYKRLIFAGIVTAVIFAAFTKVMALPLPEGILLG
ncbi:MAG: tripartite tricarboxylate transporter TctB family protein [Eubacteriales bacterium]|nr:tripartite tricarboxylate transporter TctB family protein [Eubacteriales bacterium]